MLDQMNQGTDATDLLEGRVVSAKLGIVGVVNRSPKDTTDGVSIQDCIAKEEKFLRLNYPSVASKNGIRYLAKALSHILADHIKKCLPNVKDQIRKEKRKNEALHDVFDKPVTDKNSVVLAL
ncbi:dynamin central region family protein, partial [Aphelenchoides avenae]